MELQASIDEVWTKAQVPGEAGNPLGSQSTTVFVTDSMQEGWAKRMRDYELNARRDPLDKVQKPDVGKVDWKERLARI